MSSKCFKYFRRKLLVSYNKKFGPEKSFLYDEMRSRCVEPILISVSNDEQAATEHNLLLLGQLEYLSDYPKKISISRENGVRQPEKCFAPMVERDTLLAAIRERPSGAFTFMFTKLNVEENAARFKTSLSSFDKQLKEHPARLESHWPVEVVEPVDWHAALSEGNLLLSALQMVDRGVFRPRRRRATEPSV